MNIGTAALVPQLLVATGDVLSPDLLDHNDCFITWMSRALVAEALGIRWGNANGVRDADKMLARAYGELVGIASVSPFW